MRNIFIRLFLLLLLLPSTLFAAPKFDELVVFGDSLSDTGRIYTIFSNAHKTIPLIPILPKSPPYYDGRFSNGPVWVEELSTTLNLKLVNYALGGSLAESFWESGTAFPFSFDTMLDQYIMDHLFDKNKSQHLYVIWGGGNDYLNDRADAEGATNKTVNAIKRHIEKLASFGAKNIMVLNLPDVGQAPIATSQGPDKSAHMSLLSTLHNKKLAKMVAEEKQKYAGKLDILFVDTYYYFEMIMSNPEKYHLKDTKHSCYTGGFTLAKTASPATLAMKETLNMDIMENPSLRTTYLLSQSLDAQICANPDEYLFWDIIHPTQAAHRIITASVLEVMKINGWV